MNYCQCNNNITNSMNYCQCNNNITNSSNTNVTVTRLSSDNVPNNNYFSDCVHKRERERGGRERGGRERGREGGEREKGVQ